MALVIRLGLFSLFVVALISTSDAISLRDLMPGSTSGKKSPEVGDLDLSPDETVKGDSIVDEDKHTSPIKKPISLHSLISDSLEFVKPAKRPFQELQNMLKPKPRPVITATKTLILEVTRRVTRHPVCIASRGNKPPCVSNNHGVNPDQNKPYRPSYRDESKAEAAPESDVSEMEIWQNDFKNEGLYIEPTAALKMPSEEATEVSELSMESERSRSARYLEFSRATPTVSEVKSGINVAEIDDVDGEDLSDGEGRHIFKKAQTKLVTTTLWVTRVQKVTDYGVTATLVPENCMPADTSIPRCVHHGAIKPVYERNEDAVKKADDVVFRDIEGESTPTTF